MEHLRLCNLLSGETLPWATVKSFSNPTGRIDWVEISFGDRSSSQAVKLSREDVQRVIGKAKAFDLIGSDYISKLMPNHLGPAGADYLNNLFKCVFPLIKTSEITISANISLLSMALTGTDRALLTLSIIQ